MTKSHALAVIVSISTLSHLGVAAADPLPTETFKVLPLTLAIEAAEAAIASCKAQGYSVTAAIVDRAGNLYVGFRSIRSTFINLTGTTTRRRWKRRSRRTRSWSGKARSR